MISPILNYYKLTLFFLLSHLPIFLAVRSPWYLKLIPEAVTFHRLPFVTHYLLDLFFCMLYTAVGATIGYNLSSYCAHSVFSNPFIIYLVSLALVTIVFNSTTSLVLWCRNIQVVFVTSFFSILLSDLIVISTIFSIVYFSL